ncbi:MAG: hypothetical protein PF961_11545 [Planctomycetota bacterium]|nr:hypothetical protein [Planctomycetota bacterium]
MTVLGCLPRRSVLAVLALLLSMAGGVRAVVSDGVDRRADTSIAGSPDGDVTDRRGSTCVVTEALAPAPRQARARLVAPLAWSAPAPCMRRGSAGGARAP